MKLVTRLAPILLASIIVPVDLCRAGEDVPADTRYKYSQRDSASEKPAPRVKTVETTTANTRISRRNAPHWRRFGTSWYYVRAGEVPWWGNAPGD